MRAYARAWFVTAPFRLSDIIADAARAAMSARVWAKNFLNTTCVELVDLLWEARSRVLQEELDKRFTPRVVSFDCFNRKLVMKDPVNFVGGKAQVVPEDVPVANEICECLQALYMATQSLGWDMMHIEFDGHVHPTGKDMKCLVISYFRAAEIVRRVAEVGGRGGIA